MPKTAHDYTRAYGELDSIIDGELRARAEHAIRRYFSEPAVEDGRLGFTGRRFERLDGGGDREDVRDKITAADILAVTLLGVENGIGRVTLAAIEEQHGMITRLLKQIPTEPLHAVDRSVVGPGSAAWRLWELLCQAGGARRSITAYRLLARKRPALLPVYDRVVKAALYAPHDIWECYWTWFDADRYRIQKATSLRSAVGGIDDISLLRCLDVALWMIGTDRVER